MENTPPRHQGKGKAARPTPKGLVPEEKHTHKAARTLFQGEPQAQPAHGQQQQQQQQQMQQQMQMQMQSELLSSSAAAAAAALGGGVGIMAALLPVLPCTTTPSAAAAAELGGGGGIMTALLTALLTALPGTTSSAAAAAAALGGGVGIMTALPSMGLPLATLGAPAGGLPSSTLELEPEGWDLNVDWSDFDMEQLAKASRQTHKKRAARRAKAADKKAQTAASLKLETCFRRLEAARLTAPGAAAAAAQPYAPQPLDSRPSACMDMDHEPPLVYEPGSPAFLAQPPGRQQRLLEDLAREKAAWDRRNGHAHMLAHILRGDRHGSWGELIKDERVACAPVTVMQAAWRFCMTKAIVHDLVRRFHERAGCACIMMKLEADVKDDEDPAHQCGCVHVQGQVFGLAQGQEEELLRVYAELVRDEPHACCLELLDEEVLIKIVKQVVLEHGIPDGVRERPTKPVWIIRQTDVNKKVEEVRHYNDYVFKCDLSEEEAALHNIRPEFLKDLFPLTFSDGGVDGFEPWVRACDGAPCPEHCKMKCVRDAALTTAVASYARGAQAIFDTGNLDDPVVVDGRPYGTGPGSIQLARQLQSLATSQAQRSATGQSRPGDVAEGPELFHRRLAVWLIANGLWLLGAPGPKAVGARKHSFRLKQLSAAEMTTLHKSLRSAVGGLSPLLRPDQDLGSLMGGTSGQAVTTAAIKFCQEVEAAVRRAQAAGESAQGALAALEVPEDVRAAAGAAVEGGGQPTESHWVGTCGCKER